MGHYRGGAIAKNFELNIVYSIKHPSRIGALCSIRVKVRKNVPTQTSAPSNNASARLSLPIIDRRQWQKRRRGSKILTKRIHRISRLTYTR